jgi:hypothetical protein
MTNQLFRSILLSAILLSLASTGCKQRTVPPPPPLPAAEIPGEMNKAFAKAPSDVKEVVTRLNAALEAKDYPAAYEAVQLLFNLPVATKDQRMVSVRASLTINGLLQTAQGQGDQNAAAVLTLQKKLK